MRLRKYILLLSVLLYGIDLWAIPVRTGQVTARQPDGTEIVLLQYGDEWMHWMTTLDGAAVVWDNGTICYARFDADGRRYSTGIPVASGASSNVIADARNIPLQAMRYLAAARRTPLNRIWDNRPNLIRRINARYPMTKAGGSIDKHGIIILAEFKDVQFSFSKADFDDLINGSSATSAMAYFNDQFGGMYNFQFDIVGPVPLDNDRKYYGANDSDGYDVRPEQMIIDACEKVKESVDFSKYDDDGDGEIDNVFVFFAGKDEADDEAANAECIWSHQYYVYSGAGLVYRYNGKLLNNYACTSELMRSSITGTYKMASIGTFCHEYTHTFGVPDFYDSDYQDSGGTAEAWWSTLGLMCSGNQNNDGYTPPNYNAVERYELGLSEPIPLSSGTYMVEPIHYNGRYYIFHSDYEGEYYLVECRSQEGWDSAIGGSGLLIYHIDKSNRPAGRSDAYKRTLTAQARWEVYNEVNARPDHQCADIIEADPGVAALFNPALYNKNREPRVFWPYSTYVSLNGSTHKDFKYWSGASIPVAFSSIARNGKNITFTVSGSSDDPVEVPPTVQNVEKTVFQDAAILSWEPSEADFTGKALVRYGKSGGEMTEVEVEAYEAGKYALVLEGLEPSTAYQVRILFVRDGIEGKEDESAKFTTASRKSGAWPYIWLESATRTSDGVFTRGSKIPLRLFNVEGEIRSIAWTFDDARIAPEKDGWYVINSAGTLKAIITYSDGTTDIIMKKIVL